MSKHARRVRYFILPLLLVLFNTQTLHAQKQELSNIPGRINGKKQVFTEVVAKMDKFSPFYSIAFSFYVGSSSDEDYDGIRPYLYFIFRSSKRQFLNKLPWPQTYSKFLFLTADHMGIGQGIAYYDENAKRDIQLVIEKIEKRSDGANIIVGTIDYKMNNDNQLKGPFRAVLSAY
ncbi:hypothetical protein [Sediminibacterium sp.]|jgi:hypothetical protein|uniref:hypothetical protein n=1 Tax=Sediminibacterium sp. TaxID=1917865 RepID=UPI0025E2A710|nr:hypothetical protein [Sediminibacterium sp.]MBW0176504.1 hypothetical protein [Sediminibacterium sp.]